jgi:adenylate kinase
MIILMGVAGAGKSMQGRLFADEHGYAWISTGELLRVLVTGKRRQEMLEGKLLSDEEVIKVIDKVFDLIDLNEEFVLDGFPRSINQTNWLLDQVHSGRLKLTAVFNLTASHQSVEKRLLIRGRLDDNKDAIERRFEEYEDVTLPILKHFRSEKLPVYDINADLDPIAVHDEILNFINNKK